MLKKKKTLTSPYPSMRLSLKLPMWKSQLSQSLEFAHQPFPIQNTTSHQETHTKQQWLNRHSEFTQQTSTTVSTHAHTSYTTRKCRWFKPKTWMLWVTSNAPQDKTASSPCSAMKDTTWKTQSSSTK